MTKSKRILSRPAPQNHPATVAQKASLTDFAKRTQLSDLFSATSGFLESRFQSQKSQLKANLSPIQAHRKPFKPDFHSPPVPPCP